MQQERTIVEERSQNIVVMDVFSKLIQKRILFIDDEIDGQLANGIIAQMLYLDSLSNKPIKVYINSPGGNVQDGLAIYDVSKLVKSPIHTVCVGQAASMGAILMLMGEQRSATKHSRIMFHQPTAGSYGSPDDLEITLDYVNGLKNEMYKIVEEETSLTGVKELFKLDTWFTAAEALNHKILTKVL